MSKIDMGLHYPLTVRDLPSSWLVTYAREVCEEVQSGFACGRHSDENIGVAHLRPMNISKDGRIDLVEVKFVRADVDERRLAERDVLFNNTNSPELIGKTALVGARAGGLAFSNHMTRVRFNASVLPEFGAYQLHYLWMARYYLHRCVKHVNQASISSKDFARSIPVIVPPITEQQRIVSKIEGLFSELDKGIESLKTAQAQLKVYRQAVLKRAFEGKLTAQWREENQDRLESPEQLLARIKQERAARYEQQLHEWKVTAKEWEENGKSGKRPQKPRTPPKISGILHDVAAKLPPLPISWVWEKLGWMTCGVEYGTAAKSAATGRVPVLRMGNIQNAEFDWAELVYTSDDNESAQYLLHDGDVLFNRTNSPELVGKTAIYKGERPAIFAGYLIRVNHISRVVDGQYLNLFLNSHVARQYGNDVKTDGVNQSNINGAKLSNYPFPYCSIEEQREIARILEKTFSLLDATEANIVQELEKADALRQSILKKAFTGQLVPQDPNDEPASLLLDRIKAAKAAQGQNNTRAKRRRTAATA